jgi:hypothetical protein
MIIRFDGKTVVVERSWNGFGRCICSIGCICVRLRCILCAALRLPGSRRFVPDSLLEEEGFELLVASQGELRSSHHPLGCLRWIGAPEPTPRFSRAL